MIQSLITGFPVIAASKSTLRRAIKLLVFLICTTGFIYQTYYFLEMYLEYPTIAGISVLPPESIPAPAVTVCNRNRLHRQPYCNLFPENCQYVSSTRDGFCKLYPNYCPKFKKENETDQVPRIMYSLFSNGSSEVLNAVGPQSENDLVTDCTITGKGRCNKSITIQASKNGFPHKCFAFHSLWGKPDEEPANLHLTESNNMILKLHPEEYMANTHLKQAFVFVHDPHRIANPMAEGITLRGGFQYKLYITMQKRESLPKPYKSNCTDYLSMWKKNGGYGPITKSDCIEICKIQVMMKEYGCVGQSVTYPNNYTICDNKRIQSSEEAKAKCSNGCNDACSVDDYSTTAEVADEVGELVCNKDDVVCKLGSLEVSIRFSRMVITKFKHEPKFESIELFSYIGGYMGMWLGISLVSLFDFTEMLFSILAYPIIKRRKDKKKRRRRENTTQWS